MLTAPGLFQARRGRLFHALPSPCDVLIVGDPSHLVYFANYVPSPFEFRSVESSALLVLEPARTILVADNLLGPFLEKAHADEVVAPTWYDGSKPTAPVGEASSSSRPWPAWPRSPATRIGVELAGVPAGRGRRVEGRPSRPRDRRPHSDHPPDASGQGRRRGRRPPNGP